MPLRTLAMKAAGPRRTAASRLVFWTPGAFDIADTDDAMTPWCHLNQLPLTFAHGNLGMPDQSKTEQRAKSIEQRLQALVDSLPVATPPASPPAPRARAPKPIALTLRLDPERYTRLCTHAARYTPRRSFQAILVEALDAYLDE
jgi:hypothetical protein